MDEIADDELCTVEYVYDDSGAAVIRLSGELDTSQIEHVSRTLEPLLARKPERVVFDMAALSFMDSSGIALLIQTKRQVPELEIRNAGSPITRVIEATGLGPEFGLAP